MALLKEDILKALKTNESLDSLFSIPSLPQDISSNYSDETYCSENLSAEALLTSYQDYMSLCNYCIENNIFSIADLGAGIGRGTLLSKALNLPLQFSSYEIIKERLSLGIQASKKHGLSSEGFHCLDLLQASLPQADLYFLYLPVGKLSDHILKEMEKKILKDQHFYLCAIESHGNFLSYLKEEAFWLKKQHEIPLFSKRHNSSMSIYQTKKEAKKILISQREKEDRLYKEYIEKGFISLKNSPSWSFLKRFQKDSDTLFLVQDASIQWLASSKEISYGALPQSFETLYPPRLINTKQVIGVQKAFGEIQKYHQARLQNKVFPQGLIRKIITAPKRQIEYSDGTRQNF